MVSDSNSRHNQMQYPQVRVGSSFIGGRAQSRSGSLSFVVEAKLGILSVPPAEGTLIVAPLFLSIGPTPSRPQSADLPPKAPPQRPMRATTPLASFRANHALTFGKFGLPNADPGPWPKFNNIPARHHARTTTHRRSWGYPPRLPPHMHLTGHRSTTRPTGPQPSRRVACDHSVRLSMSAAAWPPCLRARIKAPSSTHGRWCFP